MSEFPAEPKLQVLHFLIQNVHVCIKLQYINQVLLLSLLDTVPGAPPYLAGLMNMGNISVPVIDLAIFLNMPRNAIYTINMPILLCGDTQHKLGMIIDQVLGLAVIDEESQMKEQFDQDNSPFQGVITIESELTLLLNMDHIFSMNFMRNPSTEYLEY